jgi:tetratricopeptide (TPR) repeat protein
MRWFALLKDRKKLGKFLKQRRLEKDLTQEALADENISPATISQIERGNKKVSKQKILYLCKLLEIETNDSAEEEVEKTMQYEQILLSRLKRIENNIDLVDAKKGLKQLNKILNESPRQLTEKAKAFIYYLKGRAYIQKGKLNPEKRKMISAEKNLKRSIRIAEKNPDLNDTNIRVLAYHELGRLYYFKNQFKDALGMVEKGLESFVVSDSRQYVKPILQISKAIYLEKLDMTLDALKVLEAMWKDINAIHNIQVILNMYETRAVVLGKMYRHEEAIKYCNKGIEIARINEVFDRSLDLWTVRGSLYSELGELDEAEDSLLAALDLESTVSKKSLFVATYIELGKLNLKKRSYSDAVDYLQRAAALAKETNNMKGLSQALNSLGDCFYHQNMIDRAFSFYKEAYQIATAHDFRGVIKDVIVQLVQCSKELNDPLYPNYVDKLVAIEVEFRQSKI